MAIPTIVDQSMAKKVSFNVGFNRPIIISETGNFVLYEIPKSP